MSDELLPCPFCGSKAIAKETNEGHKVECENRKVFCPMNMRTYYWGGPKQAGRAWNSRTKENE